ncbi:MAG: glycosyltransferase family 1 protein [candidate division WOR-3 bacterium]
MKILLVSRWNATCGISMHAELIGREWAKKYELKVLAPYLETAIDWYHVVIENPDEDYVIRGYEQPKERWGEGKIDEIIFGDFDVIVFEGGSHLLPIKTLLKIFPQLKAKKVYVCHDAALRWFSDDFFKLNFDAIVVFDYRYQEMLLDKYPKEKIYIIPYPCYPIVKGDKYKLREELNIEKDKIVFFTFGRQPLNEYEDYFWLVEKLKDRYNIKYLILRSSKDKDERFPESKVLEIRRGAPPNETIFKYLLAVDIHLIPKRKDQQDIVVSSTVCQTLGTLTPIVFPDTRYVELLDKEVVKYKDKKDLEEKVIRLIEDENYRKEIISAQEKYVKENSAEIIAEKFIQLFKKL